MEGAAEDGGVLLILEQAQAGALCLRRPCAIPFPRGDIQIYDWKYQKSVGRLYQQQKLDISTQILIPRRDCQESTLRFLFLFGSIEIIEIG
jgi:hypothetical protein